MSKENYVEVAKQEKKDDLERKELLLKIKAKVF